MRFLSLTPETLLSVAHETSSSYGFRPLSSLLDVKTPTLSLSARHNFENNDKERLSILLRLFFERSLHTSSDPFFVFHSNIARETCLPGETRKRGEAYFTLTCLGSDTPYTEALLLVCAEHIFRKIGVKNPLIRINSMGTREDSREYFSRLAKSVRRCKRRLSPEVLSLFSSGELSEVHALLYDEEHGISDSITPSLKLLSDGARAHFERIIEHLEVHEFPYLLSPHLFEKTQHGIHTVFTISSEHTTLTAQGGRFDTLPYHLFRRKLPIVSLTFSLPKKVSVTRVPLKKQRAAKVFLIHAGEVAHLRSLRVLSQLCDAGIPVAHRLHCTKVGEQLTPEMEHYPFTIVYGQEEAENECLCLRNTATRAASFIPLSDVKCREVKRFIRSQG